MNIKKLKKLISSLEEESYNNYVGTERNADHFLEMGKCNAYGNVLELIKELENKKEIKKQLLQTDVSRSNYTDESPEPRINIHRFNDNEYDKDGRFLR